ncbi:kinase-like domain-containing protein [Syncephalis plumigaleata]|nr:kinase-like domain-containing protein [Syncephalis plumigaleata]
MPSTAMNSNVGNNFPTKQGNPDFSALASRLTIKTPITTMNTLFSASVQLDGRPGYMKCLNAAGQAVFSAEVNALQKMNAVRNKPTLPYSSIINGHVVELLDAFSLPLIGMPQQNCHCIVTRLVEKSYPLSDVIMQADNSERDAVTRELFRQSILALDAIHKTGWAHGDLKADNIQVTFTSPTPQQIAAGNTYQGLPVIRYHNAPAVLRVTIIDFGEATPLTAPPHVLGAELFRAPELWITPLKNINYVKTDVWSLGATLHSSISGRLMQPYHTRASSQWPEPLNHWNSLIDQVTAAMLNPESARRATPLELLKLAWFKGEKSGNEPPPSARRYPNPYPIRRG